MILAFLSVITLLIPVAVSGYVEEKTITQYVAVQGMYPSGDTFGLYDGAENITELMDPYSVAQFPNDDPLGWDSNNDTAFYGWKSSGIYDTRDSVYYGNYITYTGSGEHTMSVDWADMPVATYNSVRYLMIPLNITNEELADYDFARISIDILDDQVDYRIYYTTTGTTLAQINPQDIDNNTALYPITYDVRNSLGFYPNETVFLGIVATGTQFNEDQVSFTWKLEGISLDPEDKVFGSEFTDTTIWISIMMFLDSVYLVAVIFANPMIDLKVDKKGKWRK